MQRSGPSLNLGQGSRPGGYGVQSDGGVGGMGGLVAAGTPILATLSTVTASSPASTATAVTTASMLVTNKSPSSSTSSVKAKDKASKDDVAKNSRYCCPSCPKSFSRIENLTRHQANHLDVGKFACVVCKKRFTRSDLLNRHRRIHPPTDDKVAQGEVGTGDSTRPHVTSRRLATPRTVPNSASVSASPSDYAANSSTDIGVAPAFTPRSKGVAMSESPRSRPGSGTSASSSMASIVSSGMPTTGPPPGTREPVPTGTTYHLPGSGAYMSSAQVHSRSHSHSHPHQQPQGTDGYHTMGMMQPEMLTMSGLPVHQSPPGSTTTQRLTSLMEVALGPQDASAFQPTQIDPGPSTWDGFMLLSDASNSNPMMGSYDAGISWTLNSFLSESSPNGLLDTEMMSAPDTWSENMYGPQPQPQSQFERHPQSLPRVSNAVGPEDGPSGWPTKPSSDPSTVYDAATGSSRLVPLSASASSWQVVIDEARMVRPTMASLWPIQPINETVRASVLAVLNGVNLPITSSSIARPEILDAVFPPPEVLDFFLCLYLRHIHPRFPVLHLPTFDIYTVSPILLTTMMIIGSSHSHADSSRFAKLIYPHVRVAMMHMQELEADFLRSVENILTHFLLCLAGTWSGNKGSYEFAEGRRGILITACRRFRLLDCRPTIKAEIKHEQRPGIGPLEASWLAWVETEKRKRLGLSIYIFDCQYPALFNSQPYISKAETANCAFPCAEEFWEASTPESWKMLVGAASAPPSTYYSHALNCCLLSKFLKTPPQIAAVGDFGKILILYALHSYIFEWRQSTTMLNPTGLLNSIGDVAPGLSEGLRRRRYWLVDALDAWGAYYVTPTTASTPTSIAALLLHRLAYISLDVSVSDMHLVAGRSADEHDGAFAEENLRYWANSDIATSTMSHTFAMLDICRHTIATHTVADSSFEVAVCLFTGGVVCWAYAKLKARAGATAPHTQTQASGINVPDGTEAQREQCVQRVREASNSLLQMGCWKTCTLFGKILSGFPM